MTDQIIDDLDAFVEWYQGLSEETVDMYEVMTIFLNQEMYLEAL